MRRKTKKKTPGDDERLQTRVDEVAWRVLEKRQPQLAGLIAELLAAGETAETVAAAVRRDCPSSPLRPLVECAVYGCLASPPRMSRAS